MKPLNLEILQAPCSRLKRLPLYGVAFGALLVPARAEAPLSYMWAAGPKSGHILTLTWVLLIISIAVVVIISVLTLAGVILRRDAGIRREAVRSNPGGLPWIVIGVALSVIALLFAMGWTAYTLTSINRPPQNPKLTIEVIGHQWWWQVRYLSEDPSRVFETANEIHIPVGEPVRFEVKSADVIHSFWVPALGDKIDLIPNQTNSNWFEASRPGVYRGQCSEYCGKQHAHMALLVVAQPASEFSAWWDAQLQPAPAVPADALREGQSEFIAHCGVCHTVRGTRAGGGLGPDLSHLMSRHSIAAGTFPNTIAYLSGWIASPQTIKPGNFMPDLEISAPDLARIRQYLQSLE